MITSDPTKGPSLPVSPVKRWTMAPPPMKQNSAVMAAMEEYNPLFGIGPALRTLRHYMAGSAEKDFDVFGVIPEEYRDPQFYGAYLKASSPTEVDQITTEITRHIQNEQVLAEYGFLPNLGFGMLAGITDPIQWMIPGKYLFSAVKVGRNISVSRTAMKFGFAGMASNIPSEIILQAGNPILTAEDSVFSTAIAGMLSGALGIPVGMLAKNHQNLINEVTDALKASMTTEELVRNVMSTEAAERLTGTRTFSIPELGVVDGVDLMARARGEVGQAEAALRTLQEKIRNVQSTTVTGDMASMVEEMQKAAEALRKRFGGETRTHYIRNASGSQFELELPSFINLDEGFNFIASANRELDDLIDQFGSNSQRFRAAEIAADLEMKAAELRKRFPGPTVKRTVHNASGRSIVLEIPEVLDETMNPARKSLFVGRRADNFEMPEEITQIMSDLENPAYAGTPYLTDLREELQRRAEDLRRLNPGPTRKIRITDASGNVIEVEIPRALLPDASELQRLDFESLEAAEDFISLSYLDEVDRGQGRVPGQKLLPPGGQNFTLFGSREQLIALNPYTMGRQAVLTLRHRANIANDARWWPIVPKQLATPPAVRNGILARQLRMFRRMKAVFSFPGVLVNDTQVAETAARLARYAETMREAILSNPELEGFVSDADAVVMYLLGNEVPQAVNLPVTFNPIVFDNELVTEIVTLQNRLDEAINRFQRAAILAVENEGVRDQAKGLARHFGEQVTQVINDIRRLKDRLYQQNDPSILEMQFVRRHGVEYMVPLDLLYSDAKVATPDGIVGKGLFAKIDDLKGDIGINQGVIYPDKTLDTLNDGEYKNLFKFNGFQEATEIFGEGYEGQHQMVVVDKLGRKLYKPGIKTQTDLENLLTEMGVMGDIQEVGLIRKGVYMELDNFKQEFITANLTEEQTIEQVYQDAIKAIESPWKASRADDPETIKRERHARALKRARSMRRRTPEQFDTQIEKKNVQLAQAIEQLDKQTDPAQKKRLEKKVETLQTDLDAMAILKERRVMFPETDDLTTGQKMRQARAEIRARSMREMSPDRLERALELAKMDVKEMRAQLRTETEGETRRQLKRAIEELQTEIDALEMQKNQS